MTSLKLLTNYQGSSEEESAEDKEINLEDNFLHLKPIDDKLSLKLVVKPPPLVYDSIDSKSSNIVDPLTKEILYNTKYEDLYAPNVGPENPFKTRQLKSHRNTLTGFVEKSFVSDFQFETQRRTFTSYGYAIDPSVDIPDPSKGKLIGDTDKANELNGKTIFEVTAKRQGDSRKRLKNDDPSDIDGYLGPWGKFVDEKTVLCPDEEEKKALDVITAKRAKSAKRTEEKSIDEKSILHLKDPCDYQGRSFMHAPHNSGVNLNSLEPPTRCFIPKKLLHTWTGHNKAISTIKWFPQTAHLLLSCSMDSKIKLWEVYGDRRCVRSYMGHKQAVRDICFNNSGTQFLSASYDRYCKLWDTETGECISRFTSGKVPYCVKFHPEESKHHFIVAGTSNKKIICWDTRSGEVVQEYDRHLGAVNSITFIDQNRRFVSTSDDKSLRVWEWDIPVDFKYIADPTMHSMPSVAPSPNGKWLACQSMDNQILIFNAINRFKFMRKKVFKGHMVAGYACGVDFSPEMNYLISGDADGKLYFWDWKTTKLYTKFQAHEGVCSDVLWHPHETSKVATCGWDGLVKLWD